MNRTKKPRILIAESVIESLARDLASYRLDGCKSGGAEAIMSRVRKVASTHGQSYSEAWARVHAEAYKIIDADGRANIRPR